MGTFLGCCVIAAVLLYVGRKIVRLLLAISLVLEQIGRHSSESTGQRWPDDWSHVFR
jgi:hypothetical protein